MRVLELEEEEEEEDGEAAEWARHKLGIRTDTKACGAVVIVTVTLIERSRTAYRSTVGSSVECNSLL